jgi:hypothetical protein
MRSIVMLYKYDATFTGEASVTYAAYPAINTVQGCIPSFRQTNDQADLNRAAEILAGLVGRRHQVGEAHSDRNAESAGDGRLSPAL